MKMTTKELKKNALNELRGLKKELKGINPDLDAITSLLNSLPLFHRITYKSYVRGELEIYYGCMTLKILLKSGIIEISEKVELWNEDGVGYIGTFTSKTLQMECEDGLD